MTAGTSTRLAGCVLLLATLAGCGGTEARQPGSAASVNTATSASGGTVVATVSSHGSSEHAPRPAAEVFANDPFVSVVARGKITKIEYRYFDEAVAMTAMTVTIDASNGEPVGPTITAWETGGLIPVTDLSKVDQARMFGDKAVPAGAVVDFRPSYNGERAEVGDQVVLILRKVDGGPTLGGYNLVNGTLGRFTENTNRDYVRAGLITEGQSHEMLRAETVSTYLK